MQEEHKAKYDKKELLEAKRKAPSYHQKPSKEEILDEIWQLLLRHASKNECFVRYKLPLSSSFHGSPIDEEFDKLYYFIRTELEKVGHFIFNLSHGDFMSAVVSIAWDHRFL